ncbi:hypothetical protein [Modicisalibacter coralii]|uniref:hypothetical protein n=1 Tax=Modicisalibacter coralii TaxID=2304602 RepID=UPI00100A3EBE|nr:hypothetical protein [Halomonas coralii]
MTDHHETLHARARRENAAWQAARDWQQRARQARPSTSGGGVKLFFTWLLFGTLMLVGTVLGLFFLLVGWLMMPLLRHRMKKRIDALRAERAQDVGGNAGGAHAASPRSGADARHEVLEGDYLDKG